MSQYVKATILASKWRDKISVYLGRIAFFQRGLAK